MANFLIPTPTDREDNYPDPVGVRGLQWQGSAIVSGLQTLIPQQPCADWAWLAVTRGNGGAAAQTGIWTVEWHHDPSGSLVIATDVIVVPPGTSVDVCLPVKGPYVTVTTHSQTGAGTYPTGGAWRFGSYPPNAYLQRRDVLLDAAGDSIAAGATKTYLAPYVATGSCRVNVTAQNAATWHVDATVANGAGTVRQVWGFDVQAVSGHADGEFHLPPYPLTVAIQNRDASARQFWMGVTIGP